MKTHILVGIFLFLNLQFYGQAITGKVAAASNNEPLIYAGIGIIETSVATITNERGEFNLEIKGLPFNSLVRFSMVGFKSRNFTIQELINKDNLILLDNEIFKLPEVIVNPSGKIRKAGTSRYTRGGGVCGWGGTQTGKGWEVGTRIELGDLPVKLKSIHIRINSQSYDSTLFRLHIRNIENNMPVGELLTEDILISLKKETGWIGIDLDKYNLVYEGDIALSLEWIKISGLDNNKFITVNGQKRIAAGVTLDKKRNQGCLFTKWGTEAKWVRHDNESPAVYLTVQ
jgi:hypothetical protein